MDLRTAKLLSFLDHPYDPGYCFVCACELTHQNKTTEHVIPKWLQNRYDLHNCEVVLSNGTGIRYKQLVIECCHDCNNLLLSPLEKRVCAAFDAGWESVSRLDTTDILRWLAKLFLGILYKELFLASDRSDTASAPIGTKSVIKEYSILHFWLMMASSFFEGYSPGSVWVLPAQVPNELASQFDLADCVEAGVIALRIGGTIVIADFMENGIHAELVEQELTQLQNIKLHPMQFRELVAQTVYRASLLCLKTTCNIEALKDGTIRFRATWRPALPSGELMLPGCNEKYAQFLSYYTGLPTDKLMSNGMVRSWLADQDGKPLFIPLTE